MTATRKLTLDQSIAYEFHEIDPALARWFKNKRKEGYCVRDIHQMLETAEMETSGRYERRDK